MRLKTSMEDDNIIKDKSKKFAIRIVKLYQYLSEKNEDIMSKQLLRSGTSIGANVAESQYAASKNDFLNKLYIALKECNETLYWIDLLYETSYLDEKQYVSINLDCEELKKLLVAATKTLRFG